MQPIRFVLMSILAAMTVVATLVAPATIPVAAAQGIGSGPHVTIRLVAETERPAPGTTIMLALDSTPQKGWHAYWLNPGDAGLPARADWRLPAGVSAGALRYPVPQRLVIAGLMNYVFEAPFAPLVPLTIPAEAAPGTRIPVALTLDYLVCTDQICVPEKAALQTELTVGDGAVAPAQRARFDAWRAALPRAIGTTATFERAGETLRIGIPFPADAAGDAGHAYFFPQTRDVIDYAAPQSVVRDGDRLVIETRTSPGGVQASATAIEGVLALPGAPGVQGLAVRATAGKVPPAQPPAKRTGLAATIAGAFLAAVLGGLVLNVMPCVFPILSLKALSLARANGEGSAPRAEALAYTAGVVIVCLALGGVLLGLRAAGSSAGWAFQLQNPQIIVVLLILTSAIALNLAGLFEINTPGFIGRAAGHGHGGAFATGALAAFVATPCSGPFMASALGAALVLPWPAAMAVFAGLGLGIALPFLLLGFIPALRRRMPRPGAWMATLRHLLSIPMFATALALAWVLGHQAGSDGMAIGVGAAMLAGIALWWGGARQRRGRSGAWIAPAPLIAAALAAALAVHPTSQAAGATATLPAGAEPFSEARLAQLRAENRPVFAYFTADWCLSCKVNEKTVIETQPVESALKTGKVAVLVGDWTRGDPALGRFIEQHQRAGVPLYLWYRPGAASPEILPQILTQRMMIDRAQGR